MATYFQQDFPQHQGLMAYQAYNPANEALPSALQEMAKRRFIEKEAHDRGEERTRQMNIEENRYKDYIGWRNSQLAAQQKAQQDYLTQQIIAGKNQAAMDRTIAERSQAQLENELSSINSDMRAIPPRIAQLTAQLADPKTAPAVRQQYQEELKRTQLLYNAIPSRVDNLKSQLKHGQVLSFDRVGGNYSLSKPVVFDVDAGGNVIPFMQQQKPPGAGPAGPSAPAAATPSGARFLGPDVSGPQDSEDHGNYLATNVEPTPQSAPLMGALPRLYRGGAGVASGAGRAAGGVSDAVFTPLSAAASNAYDWLWSGKPTMPLRYFYPGGDQPVPQVPEEPGYFDYGPYGQ